MFVNREQMMERMLKTDRQSSRPLTFEIGSNSDLVLENSITGNLPWTIEEFAKNAKGALTFPTKFRMVEPLLGLNHKGRVIFRMSVNPDAIIREVEIGTSPLGDRICALNSMAAAGYKTGLLIAPVILTGNWQAQYAGLIDRLSSELSHTVKKSAFIEIIFMTYSFVQNAINTEAFPTAPVLYDREKMTGRGRGKYWYRDALRAEGEEFFKERLGKALPDMPILYIV